MAMSSQEFKNAGGEVMKPIMVSMTAPSTLPQGYTFEAFLNDDKNRPFVCEVVRSEDSKYIIRYQLRIKDLSFIVVFVTLTKIDMSCVVIALYRACKYSQTAE